MSQEAIPVLAENQTIGTTAIIPEEMVVRKIDYYKPAYKAKYTDILVWVEQNMQNELPSTRFAFIDAQVDLLRGQFKAEREIDYSSKTVVLSVDHSCTKGSSGGTKDCGWKYVGANHPGIYTLVTDLRLEGQAKRYGVYSDGAVIGIKQSKSGKGRIYGRIFGTFRYRPSYILEKIEEDSINLFANIIGESKNLESFLDYDDDGKLKPVFK